MFYIIVYCDEWKEGIITAVILFRAFKIQEFTNEFNTRLTALERRLEGKDNSVRLSIFLSLSLSLS